jgi:hypothetical protein
MDDRIRTSDADRDLVAARLRDHYAEGRLTSEELDERIGTALNAKTFGDLRPVLADLPGPMPAPLPGPAPALVPAGPGRRPVPVGRHHRRGPRLLPLLVVALVVAFAASGGGALLFAVKVVAIAVAAMLAIFAVMAFTVGRFIRRARRHWYAGHFVHHDTWFPPGGFGPHPRNPRW